MSFLRKALALVGTGAAAATLVALPASSASAATLQSNRVTLNNVWFSAVDDDSTIFGSSFEYASGWAAQKTFLIGPGQTSVYDNEGIRSVCAGNEVDGVVNTEIEQVPGTAGDVRVTVYFELHEGNYCYNPDVDSLASKTFYVRPGNTHLKFKTNPSNEGSKDAVNIDFWVANTRY